MYASDENYPWGQCSHGWAGLRLEVRLTCQELRLEWWGYGTPSWQRMAFQTEQLGTVPLPGTDIGPMWQKSSKGQACARSGDLVHHLHPLQLSHLWALLKWAWEPPGSGLSWDLKISVHCLPAKKTAFFHPQKTACSPFSSLQRAQLTAAGLKSREVLTTSTSGDRQRLSSSSVAPAENRKFSGLELPPVTAASSPRPLSFDHRHPEGARPRAWVATVTAMPTPGWRCKSSSSFSDGVLSKDVVWALGRHPRDTLSTMQMIPALKPPFPLKDPQLRAPQLALPSKWVFPSLLGDFLVSHVMSPILVFHRCRLAYTWDVKFRLASRWFLV